MRVVKEQYKAWGEYQTKAQMVAKISYAFDKVEDLLSSMRLVIEVKRELSCLTYGNHKSVTSTSGTSYARTCDSKLLTAI